ncbi:MAG: ATP-binding cassette domain-containing protein [Acidimicrobiales bacterium]
MQFDTLHETATGGRPSVTVWVDGQAHVGLDGHTLGRDASATIRVDHAQVSRRHAALRFDGLTWVLDDMGSTNGLHDGYGPRPSVVLAPGRTQVWLGPPDSSPSVLVDVVALTPAATPAPPSAWAPPAAASPQPATVLTTAGLEGSLGQLSQVIRPQGGELVLGRADECDISIPDPLVSRRHARFILGPTGGRIVDLGSDNGTYVNGQRVRESTVGEGDLVEVGKAQFVLTDGQLRQHVAHGLPLQAEDLTVTVDGGLVLLRDVSFLLPAGSMTAVIGPSGSGKSTLLNALTGRRPADAGRVYLGGRDLYTSDDGLGRRIGFVPQNDPVHETLTVRHALVAAARLRLPADTSMAEIADDVNRIAAQLGLDERLDTRVQSLSGGQRKRVSVGYELVGEPQALILDEPTSGLDPGMERDLMSSLRQLADRGTTTIVVTHSVQSVELCDLVLVLAPGGRLAFIGPPAKVADHFGCSDLASVFTLLGTRRDADWELEFARTTSYLRFGGQQPPAPPPSAAPLPPRSFGHDLRIMVVRYLRSLLGDRRRSVLLLLQAPILGLVLSLLLFRDAFGGEPGSPARQYLLATVLAMTWLGGSNSVREVVQDRDVFRREMAVGVSAFGFVLSRWIVLGAATILQAIVLHVVASSRQVDDLGPGLLFGSGQLELILALAGVGVVSVGIGLLISAVVTDTSKALTALPLVVIPALLLSGLLVPTAGRAGVEQVTWLNPIQWGGSMAAVAVDLQGAEGCSVPGAEVETPGTGAMPGVDACQNGRWERRVTAQLTNAVMVVVWAAVLLVASGLVAGWNLRRPLRRG